MKHASMAILIVLLDGMKHSGPYPPWIGVGDTGSVSNLGCSLPSNPIDFHEKEWVFMNHLWSVLAILPNDLGDHRWPEIQRVQVGLCLSKLSFVACPLHNFRGTLHIES